MALRSVSQCVRVLSAVVVGAWLVSTSRGPSTSSSVSPSSRPDSCLAGVGRGDECGRLTRYVASGRSPPHSKPAARATPTSPRPPVPSRLPIDSRLLVERKRLRAVDALRRDCSRATGEVADAVGELTRALDDSSRQVVGVAVQALATHGAGRSIVDRSTGTAPW